MSALRRLLDPGPIQETASHTWHSPGELRGGLRNRFVGRHVFGIIKLENNIYNSKRLGIFERGMRYGKFIVPFDELKLISFGAPKTFSEKHLPTLEKHSGSRVPEAKELVRWGRQTALTIHLNNGKLLVWLAFGPVFGKEVLEEFLSMIDERAHAQLRGTSLTDEERRQIEAL